MAYYPAEVVEEVRLGNDIVGVISSYVPLKQKGNKYFGLCPFHNEKTPSFSVSPDKQLYYCFGCGASGNVYSFVMQMENLDFGQAVQRLADNIRYRLPEESKEGGQKAKQRERLYSINKAAARFFYENRKAAAGSHVEKYLDERGISPKTRVHFGLGYSGRSGALVTYLRDSGWDEPLMAEAGLLVEKDGEQRYERFRNRLMFPILDVQGRVTGFGGRILGEGQPKYLNSPETPVFDKSRNLYGLNFAKKSGKEELILVEGYMDVISLHQAGFVNAVASLGTAFSSVHARHIRKYTDSVILLFDSDEAGSKAALRASGVLSAAGIRVKVLQVADAKDPDEFIKKFGPEAFGKVLDEAKSHILFQLGRIQNEYDLSDTDQKVQFTLKAAEVLADLTGQVEQDAYIKRVSEETELSEQAIRAEVAKRQQAAQKLGEPTLESINPNRNKNLLYAGRRHEKGLIEARKNLLRHMSGSRFLTKKLKGQLLAEELEDQAYGKLLDLIFDLYEKNQEFCPAEIINYFETVDEQKKIAEIYNDEKQEEDIDEKRVEKDINESIKTVKLAHIKGLMAKCTDPEKLKKMVEDKNKIEKLYITFSDG